MIKLRPDGRSTSLVILAFAFVGLAQATPPAFPGAVGFGSTATGGRGGTVVYVTNLNDSGTGSFRSAVGTRGATVVFAVGGYVQALSPISFASNLTIAGQTAPGQGFGVFGSEMSFSGSSNCIVRHMRFRDGSLDPNWPGTSGTNSHTNAMNLYNTNGMMFDHCSLEFAAYNNVDSTSAVNVTFQNCIVADPIKEQQFNFHLDTGPGTFIDNIFANGHNRSILGKANLQYVNNTVYNYQAGFTTGDSSGTFYYDFINNDFISGPATTNKNDAYYQVDGNQHAYAVGNLVNGKSANSIGATALSTYYFTSANATTPTTSLPIASAATSVINNLDNAGALPRDQVDAQVIGQVASGGSSGPGGGLYSTQAGTGLSNSGYGTITGGTAPADSDGDGMPDYWYSANNWVVGTKMGPSQATDGSGYTNLEEYLNWLAGPHAICQKSMTVQIDLSQYTAGLKSPTYSVAAIASGTTIAPAGIGGAATTIAGTVTVSGSIATFTPTSGSVGLGGFSFTATGTNGSITNTVYVCVTATTQPVSVKWVGDGTANSWDDTNANNLVWTTGAGNVVWTQGDTPTLDDTGSESPAINLADAISAGALTVSTVNNYTLEGTGSLMLTGTSGLTVNGFGTGSLTFSNSGTNSIAGPVSITDATVNVNSSNALGANNVLTLNNATINITVDGVSLFNSSIAVLTASSLNFPHNGGSDFLPAISGTSPVNFSLNGTTVTLSNTVSGFTSTFQVTGPGNFRMDNPSNWGVPNGVLELSGGAGIDNRSNGACTIPLGSLSGSAGSYLYGSDQSGAAGTLCTYTIGSLNLSTTFAGTLENSGSQTVAITKTGTGTLTLSGTNTYTGATTVSGGTLYLAGTASLGNTAVSVASGCSLLGTGTIGSTSGGAVTMASGTTLSPNSGAGQYGTLTVGNGLSLAGTTIPLNVSSSPTGTNDQVVLQGGTLALSGTNALQLNLVNGALGAGTYTLIGGGSATTGTVANLTNNLPAATRQTLAITTAAGAVDLNVTGSPASLVWTGTASGAWDLNTTSNWTNGGTAGTFYNLDAVAFNDTSTKGTVTVTGTLDPATLTVSSSSTSYTFSGSGAIGGVAALTKSGTTTLTISNSGTNTFTGGVTLNGGELTFTSGTSLGTGTVTLNGGELNFGASGLTINNNFNVTGTSTVQVGKLVTTWNGNLTGSSPLTINVPTSPAGVILTPTGTWNFNSTLNLAGALRFDQPAGTTWGCATTAFNLGNSGVLYNEASGDVTVNLGSLTGTSGSILQGSDQLGPAVDTYTIGALNTTTSYGGTITDGTNTTTPHTTSITKVGTGTLTLTGAETYSGTTLVEGGTLVVNGSITSASGSTVEVTSGSSLTLGSSSSITADTILIDAGGTMTGGGTLNGALGVTNNGSISISSGGTFAMNGVVVNNGSIVVTNGTTLSSTGTFVNNGTLDLTQAAQTLPANLVNNGTVLLAPSSTPTDTPTMPEWALALLAVLVFLAATPFLGKRPV